MSHTSCSPLACIMVALPLGCVVDPAQASKDSASPGDSLGTYQVHGILVDSTCGPAAFGSTDKWDFSIKLSRDGKQIFWNNGSDSVEGAIADDGKSFSFATTVASTIQPTTNRKVSCKMQRMDSFKGQLAPQGDSFSGFSGTLSYQFSQSAESDCSEAMATEGVLGLPCAMSYSLQASRQ